jgi:membrane peptidoglycan carboxypeptidase
MYQKWLAEYKSKLVSAEEAAKLVEPGDWVEYAFGVNCSYDFDKALAQRKDELYDVKIKCDIGAYQHFTAEADPSGEIFTWNSWHVAAHDKKKAINWKIFSRKLMVSFLIIAIAGLAGLIGVFAVAARDLPKWDPELLSGAKTTIIYDDKEEFAAGLHAGENRTEVSLDKVPQDFIDAFIATEDRGFYDHHGINYRGIIRSLVSNITSGDLKGQGASTITQQLARNAFLSFDKKWERKIKEILLAFKIESAYSKDEILTMYLNLINFGSGAYGVQAAAETYFGKDVSELNLAECSMLAGVPNAPSLNPFQNLEWSKKRQKIVLYNMVEAGYIDQATADEAYAVELEFRKSHPSNSFFLSFITLPHIQPPGVNIFNHLTGTVLFPALIPAEYNHCIKVIRV